MLRVGRGEAATGHSPTEAAAAQLSESATRTGDSPQWTIREASSAVEPTGRRQGQRVSTASVSSISATSANFGFYDKFTLAAWIYPATASGAIVARAAMVSEGRRLRAVPVKTARLQVNLVQRWLDDCLRVETERVLEPNQWHHVAMTYDGSRLADGIQIYVDGEPQKLQLTWSTI